MSDTLIKLLAVCVGCSVMCLLIRENAPHMARLLSLAAAISVFSVCLYEMRSFFSFFSELSEKSGFTPYATVLLKACGLGIITRFSCEICRDAGETALAAKAELCGKCAILLCALPILRLLFGLIKDMLQC